MYVHDDHYNNEDAEEKYYVAAIPIISVIESRELLLDQHDVQINYCKVTTADFVFVTVSVLLTYTVQY